MRFVDAGIEPPPPSMDRWQTLSTSLLRELNLFAGQPYLRDLDDARRLEKALGPDLNASVELTWSFVRAWYGLRRKGRDFSGTHWIDGRWGDADSRGFSVIACGVEETLDG